MNKIYKFVSTLAILFIFALSFMSTVSSFTSTDSYDVMDLSFGWIDEDGNEIDLEDLHDVQYITRYINYDINQSSIIYRARNCYTDIYINDELIEQDLRSESTMFGISPGSRWHIISLPITDELVKVSIKVSSCYSNSHGTIDNIYVGQISNLYRNVNSTYIVGFVLCIFVQLLSLVIISIYLYLKRLFNVGIDLFYLGLTAFFCAQWSGCESLVWQLYVGHSSYIHFIGYMSLITIPLAFGLFAVGRLKGRPLAVAKFYSIISALNMIMTSLLHITGIKEFHYTLFSVHILLVIFIPFLVMLMLSFRSSSSKTSVHYGVIPLLIFVYCLLMAIYKYIAGSYSDYSNYIRVALVSFLLCLILFQIREIAITFSKGMKADMLHDLALTDHMTGLFNRTALNEHTIEYEQAIENHSPLGIIQLDVNNLKSVNDNQGHEMGDKLINTAAQGLKTAFKDTASKIYRTGGDEFLVIINEDKPLKTYEKGMSSLTAYCEEFNSQPNPDFKLIIAHGFVTVTGHHSLSEAIDMADMLMYQNKRELKERQKKEA